MARPYQYKILHSKATFGGKEESTIAHPVMYGIKNGDDFVCGLTTNIFNNQRKYYRMFYVSQKAAQNVAEKLNRNHSTDSYRVVKI